MIKLSPWCTQKRPTRLFWTDECCHYHQPYSHHCHNHNHYHQHLHHQHYYSYHHHNIWKSFWTCWAYSGCQEQCRPIAFFLASWKCSRDWNEKLIECEECEIKFDICKDLKIEIDKPCETSKLMFHPRLVVESHNRKIGVVWQLVPDVMMSRSSLSWWLDDHSCSWSDSTWLSWHVENCSIWWWWWWWW